MNSLPPQIRALTNDERGSTLLEFAFVAPVLALVLVGGFDIAHTLYMRAVLQGVVQKVARDSALESGSVAAQQAALDSRVGAQVKHLFTNASPTFSRRYYRTFSSAAAALAENWTDTDGDGLCNNGEPYQDDNNNNIWDRDGGDDGQGGAKDKTVYTVTVNYPRVFPLAGLIGIDQNVELSATTVLANQPYNDQASYGAPTARNCL